MKNNRDFFEKLGKRLPDFITQHLDILQTIINKYTNIKEK